MTRHVSSRLVFEVAAPARLALQIAVAHPMDGRDERLSISTADGFVTAREYPEPHGGRMHVADVVAGPVTVEYEATVRGAAPPPPPADAQEQLVYLRPSRYAESDRLAGFATGQFGAVDPGQPMLAAISSFVGQRLAYVGGSSGPTDGATETLLHAQGVCRDYAHLVVGLLRAMEIPARLASVYAPGLDPMDFHAVAEAWVDGAWHVLDATLLAPRSSLVRIATGRDAADTAFLSSYGGDLELHELEVVAYVDGALPDDDITQPAFLA